MTAEVGLIFGLHLLNGSAAWFEQLPSFPRTLDFSPLMQLFPNARRVWGSGAIFDVGIVPAAIAFAFFLNTKVGFSLGITNFVWLAFGAMLIGNGVPLDNSFLGAKKANLLRFGAYLGLALIIFYTGRRYYLNVLSSSLGFKRERGTPVYAVWSMRVLLAVTFVAVWVLTQAGLPLAWSLLGVLLVYLTFVVMSRLVCEAGIFFLQAFWMPVGVVVALAGFEAIGPTAYIILAMISIMLVGDPRTTLMPYLNTGLRMAERKAHAAPGKFMPVLAVMVIGGFLVAGAVTLGFQYRNGFNQQDNWAQRSMPTQPFDNLARHTLELSSQDRLSEVTEKVHRTGFGNFRPAEGAVMWTLAGLALVLAFGVARLRLPWWPLHPLIFLVWGTYPIGLFGGAFLIGWAIKAGIIKTMGAEGYHKTKPFMIGMIAGDLMAALVWMLIGVVYYLYTGQPPQRYAVFPG